MVSALEPMRAAFERPNPGDVLTATRRQSNANLTGESYLKSVQEVLPTVAMYSDEASRDREIPPELANELKDRGLFRLLLPRSVGGVEMDHPDFLDIVEAFAEVDGSVAWCINQNNVYSTRASVMSPELAQEIWGDTRAVVTNGPPQWTELEREGDGFRLSGRWNFSSGLPHATWLAALTPVDDAADDGELPRTMILPKSEVELVDNWQVNGLRGTGSLGFEVKDTYVPFVRTFCADSKPREPGPLYAMPMVLMFASGFATVALGAARAALDALIEMAGGKTIQARGILRDDPATWRQVGQAEATWRSARAFLRQSASEAWRGTCEDGGPSLDQRITLRLAATHGIRMAVQVMDAVYNLFGSQSIFERNPVQRRFQDVHVISQQIQGRMDHYDAAGQHFLGMEAKGSF